MYEEVIDVWLEMVDCYNRFVMDDEDTVNRIVAWEDWKKNAERARNSGHALRPIFTNTGRPPSDTLFGAPILAGGFSFSFEQYKKTGQKIPFGDVDIWLPVTRFASGTMERVARCFAPFLSSQATQEQLNENEYPDDRGFAVFPFTFERAGRTFQIILSSIDCNDIFDSYCAAQQIIAKFDIDVTQVAHYSKNGRIYSRQNNYDTDSIIADLTKLDSEFQARNTLLKRVPKYRERLGGVKAYARVGRINHSHIILDLDQLDVESLIKKFFTEQVWIKGCVLL